MELLPVALGDEFSEGVAQGDHGNLQEKPGSPIKALGDDGKNQQWESSLPYGIALFLQCDGKLDFHVARGIVGHRVGVGVEPGQQAQAVTFGNGWSAVVTTSQNLLIYDGSGALVQSLDLGDLAAQN